MLKNIIGLLAGLLFGLGLLVSGMTDPVKVQGFFGYLWCMGYLPCTGDGRWSDRCFLRCAISKASTKQLDRHTD